MSSILSSFPGTWLVFALLFNGLMVGLMVYQKVVSDAARGWPTVTGRVVSSRVSRGADRSEADSTPWVTYAYEVGGRSYKSSILTRGDITLAGDEHAQRVVARYPKGAEVTVTYNPNNPEDAFLESFSASRSGLWGALVLGNLVVPVAAWLYQFIKSGG